MAYVERIRHHGVAPRDRVVDEPTNNVDVVPNHEINVVSRVIWFVAGVLLLLLTFRFVLALLGANPANSFAHFIYSTSYPFVAPFFNLFSYNNIQSGISRIEIYTLVAMAVYVAVAWVLVALTNIGRRP
jgi:YggT family protein